MKIFGVTDSSIDSFAEFDQALPECRSRRHFWSKFRVFPLIRWISPPERKKLTGNSMVLKSWVMMDTAKVVDTGSKVTKFQVDEIVFYAGDYTRDGSFQEYELVNQKIAAKAPVKNGYH